MTENKLLLESDLERLGQRAVLEFEKNGYWISPRFFDQEEVEELRHELMRTFRGENDFDCMHYFKKPDFDPESGEFGLLVNGWWVNKKIRETIYHSQIGYIVSKLLGAPAVRLALDQIIYKPSVDEEDDSSSKTHVGWHQDAAHFTVFNTTNYVSAWIALQDTDLSNGAMIFIEGSHRWGLNEDAATFLDTDLDALKTRFCREGRDWVEIPAILKAGQASFHSGLIFHGSTSNTSGEPRLSLVLHFMPQGTAYNKYGGHNPMGVQMGPYVKHGDLCDDPFFPKTWPSTPHSNF